MNQLIRISQVKTRLVECMPFFGRLTLLLKPRLSEFSDFVSSMAVAPDGSLIVNQAFCESLEDQELAACLIHEVMHPALLYWDRLQTRLPGLFNEAHDYSINQIISESVGMNIYLPPFMLLNQDYEDLSAEEIYEILFRKRKSNKEKSRALVGDCRPDLATGQAVKWEEELNSAVRYHWGVNGRGSLPAGLSRAISKFLNVPEIDWVEAIKRYIGEFGRRSSYSYSKFSNRSESSGEYLPALQSSLPQVAVLLDTSGSITKSFLTKAVSEISGICDDLNIEVRVIVIDAKIHQDITTNDIECLTLKGHGGSNFDPAFERLESEGFTGIVVAITDGAIKIPVSKPENIRETLWLIRHIDLPPTDKWGEVIRFDET